MKNLIKVTFILFISGCSIFQQPGKFECTYQQFQSIADPDSKGTPYYVSEAFSNHALDNYTIAQIKKHYSRSLDLKKTPIENIHDPSIIDTIYKFSNATNTIAFYRARHRDFIRTFEVTEPYFNLYGCVSIGIEKKAFAKQFNLSTPISDTIQIGNKEKTAVLTFYFEDNKLSKIESTPYMD